jgi:curved DNA-binding protein CbpA
MERLERLERLIEKFKDKSNTHPYMSSLWVNYLELKKENLDMRLTQGEKIVDELPESGDINASLLMCLLTGIPVSNI